MTQESVFALELVALGFGLVLLAAAALHDVAVRTIPNALPLLLAIDGTILRVLKGDIAWGLAASGAVFILAALCWRRGLMGGGDVKLLGAATLLVAPGMSVGLLLNVSLAGGALALIYLALRRAVAAPVPGRPAGLLRRILRTERRRVRAGGPLPYATSIAAGAIFTLFGA
ncbi:prepilin peptidase [Siccirubricoccus deserti]|uniref:Prepilin peptidase n=1 Tax=Siccirubricoccus deserti TaxID=2013562 RepID=A0A9X0R4F7_9PROT|nr:A24 family peptidase [Siccirubricoccus deserti]MBC4018885.1 prepilin peptidase [Siccirubricoccus deserti]